jgi:hypothetical protein
VQVAPSIPTDGPSRFQERAGEGLDTHYQHISPCDLPCPRFPSLVHFQDRLIRRRCWAWQCPTCGPCKVRRFQAIGRKQVATRPAWWLLTLTLPPRARAWPLEWQLALVRTGWGKLHQRINRHLDRTVAYLAVPEQDMRGCAHLHVLIDSIVSKSWLSKAWTACGGGYVVDVCPITDAGYRVHYLSKQLLAWDFLQVPRGFRRYGYGGGLDMKGVRPVRRRRDVGGSP